MSSNFRVEIHEEIVHQLTVTAGSSQEARTLAEKLIGSKDPRTLAKDSALDYSIVSEGLTGTWSTQPLSDSN
jgi:hypothetical protein